MDRVSVVVHPQSVVHSMVEFIDGSMLAQLSTPDMCLPIQYALLYPERAASDRVQTNLARLGSLEFTNDEDVEEARWLRTYVGKTGFVQLGFAHQGIMMVYEASTDWYDHYQRLLELSEDFGGIPIDEPGPDDEI